MKKIFLTLVSVGISLSAMAQLSTGEQTARSIRTGNRAQAGDYGLYVGADLEYIQLENAPGTSVDFLPLVNLKYMYSNNIEIRLGIDLNKYSQNAKGEIKEGNKTYEVQDKTVSVDHAIYPGIAYHFAKSNILDVYAGAELPLGYERTNETIVSDGDNDFNKRTKFAFNIGLGGFVGLQAYVANLPIAVGVEYGIFSRFDLGLKYKNVSKEGKGSDEETVYFTDPDAQNLLNLNGGAAYDKLSARNGSVGGQLRFTLTYFFKK
jgi:hypothetical protein